MTRRRKAFLGMALIFLIGFVLNALSSLTHLFQSDVFWSIAGVLGAVACWISMRFAWDAFQIEKREG